MNNYGFSKEQRSTFSYWFAHWCAFQMVALCLHIWKPKYLFHDIEKPWLMLFWKDYRRVQKWHRSHNKHHIGYILGNSKYLFQVDKLDIDAMIIDNECSRFTKKSSPLTAIEFCEHEIEVTYSALTGPNRLIRDFYKKVIERANELGLEK